MVRNMLKIYFKVLKHNIQQKNKRIEITKKKPIITQKKKKKLKTNKM